MSSRTRYRAWGELCESSRSPTWNSFPICSLPWAHTCRPWAQRDLEIARGGWRHAWAVPESRGWYRLVRCHSPPPLTQWGDAMAAAEASGLLDPVEHGFILRRDKAAWVVESGDGEKIIGADRSGPRALCLAIVAILERSLREQCLASRADRDDISWPEPECVVHARA